MRQGQLRAVVPTMRQGLSDLTPDSGSVLRYGKASGCKRATVHSESAGQGTTRIEPRARAEVLKKHGVTAKQTPLSGRPPGTQGTMRDT